MPFPVAPRLNRRAVIAGAAATAVARLVRADAGALSVTITLEGKTYRYDAGGGRDLGDFKSPSFTQGCIRVARDDCPISVMFRPDRAGDRVEVVFELGELWNGTPRNLPAYRAEIASGGTAVAAIDVPKHYWFSRWRWQSAERPITADIGKLIADGSLPPYQRANGHADDHRPRGLPPAPTPTARGAALGLKGPTHASASLPKGYGIMELAGIEPHMGATGERPDIGLLTEAQAKFICIGDNAALAVTRAQAEAAGTLPWHMRDEKTGAPVDLDAYPTMSWYPDGNVGKPRIVGTATGIEIDAAHQPALAYVPYLLTGDPYHLEDLQFAVTYNRGWFPPEYRLSIPQTRAFAWSLRSLAQAARVTPDAVPKWLLPRAYWQRDLDRTRDWFTKTYINDASPLRRVFRATDNPENARDEGPAVPGGTWIAPWMDEFLAAVLGWVVLMGHDAWRPAFDWKIASTLARTDGKSGWLRAVSTPYRMLLRPDKTAPYVSSWGDAWSLNAKMQGWHPAFPDEIEGHDPTYFTYTRGALALARRLGIDGADANLRWLEGELSRRQAAIDYKWQLV